MERYSEYKDSGVKWLGEIPSHWEVKRLGSYFTERRVKVSDKEYEPLSVTKLGIFPQWENVAKTNDGDNRKLVRKGDFVINSRSDRKGSSGVSDRDGSVSLINIVLQPRKTIIASYTNYLLKSYKFIEEYYRNGRGIVADLWTTRFDEMKMIKVAIPSIEEQKAIANYLDTATSKIDEAIAQQQKMIDLLNERKQIIINNAVTKGLDPNVKMKPSGIDWIGDIPEHWEVMPYRYLFYNLDYLRIPITADQRSRNNPLYNYYGASGVIDKIDYYNVDDKVLLIGEDGANLLLRNLPLIYKAEGKFWVNNHAHILKPIRDDYDYMAYVMEAADYTLFITGSAQPKLSQANLNCVKLPIPPIEEQKKIVREFEKKTLGIEKAIQISLNQISLLQERKQIIINEVVTGKVNIQNKEISI